MILQSIIIKLKVEVLYNNGNKKNGQLHKIRMAGYNGIANFIKDEEQKMIKDKSIDGKQLPVIMDDLKYN